MTESAFVEEILREYERCKIEACGPACFARQRYEAFEAGRLAGLEEAKGAMCVGCRHSIPVKTFGESWRPPELWHVDSAGLASVRCSARAIREIAEGK